MATTRERLIQSAIETVAENGIEAATTAHLAKVAGCSEAMIYKCFNNKFDMMDEVFIMLDSKVSAFVVDNIHLLHENGDNLKEIAYIVWNQVMDYLLENRNEALFLIRFRYSNLYNQEIRARREAYNGSFEGLEQILENRFGAPNSTYRGFLVNFAFEITLSFAEKFHTNRLEYNASARERIWLIILGAIGTVIAHDVG